ncbi:MAG: aminotransferase class V-fold PLP-dependent enzyme [Actinomycetota bacterium]|jgi:L-cysteine/cystine lyase|nr:aminotransferase class V-fold PLP-dependent enzyme [Actinomycetota bacterium]
MPRLDTAKVREQLPATTASVYLNTGTYGPISRRASVAIAQRAAEDFEHGRLRGGMQASAAHSERLAALRGDLACLVGADANEIALTRSTTEGVNLGIWGRSWSEGDEVVTTSQEHPGILFPLALLRRRYGVKITFADVGHGDAARTLQAFEDVLHPGVKMVALSHVLYTTGAVLPLLEITDMAHSVGAVVLVDGAQSVGAVPVDMHALGIDYYAFSGQKWLCGPDGSGGLFVRADMLSSLEPSFVSFATVDFRTFDAADPATFVLPAEASCLETGTVYRPAVLGFAEAVSWLKDEVGLDAAEADLSELSGYCRERAAEIPGATVMSPPGQASGLVSVHIGDDDTAAAVEYLREAGVLIRNIHENNALRISTGFYNTKDDVDLALEKIYEFMKR